MHGKCPRGVGPWAPVEDLFPYPRLRSGQREFLADARAALGEGAILLAQAPTGLGKTAVALTAALESGRERGRRVLFATCRRSQHRIAVDTLQRMPRPVKVADLIAREAMCPSHETHSSDSRAKLAALQPVLHAQPLHVQDVVDLARRYRLCPHALAVHAARRAEVIVCDYNYLFSPIRPRILRALELTLPDCLLIVDEAHNLPDRCRQAVSARVSVSSLRRLARAVDPPLRPVLLHLARHLLGEARAIAGESRVPVDALDRIVGRCEGEGGRSWTRARLARAMRGARHQISDPLRPVAEETCRLFHDWDRPNRLRLLSTTEGGALSLLVLDAQIAARPAFRDVAAALLMSGTLHPGAMYRDVLGLPPVRTRIRSYPPIFPPGNRLLVASKWHSSAYRERPDCYRGFALEIEALSHAIPGNVAAFFPSYALAQGIGALLQTLHPPKVLLWERRGQTKAQKERLLQVLGQPPSGGCLLLAVQGGSFSEGIDYPGDLLNGVLVVGLALQPPELGVGALRTFYSTRFGRRRAYEYASLFPALNRVVQCAGRCIRSPEDVGAIVLLDRRLLRPFYRSRLPLGFEPLACDDLPRTVRTFFESHALGGIRAAEAGRRGGPDPGYVAGSGGGPQNEGAEGIPPPRDR